MSNNSGMTRQGEMFFSEDLKVRGLPEGRLIAYETMIYSYHCIVIKNNYSWCAYIGLEFDTTISGYDYHEIPLDVHGGLTFAGLLDNVELRSNLVDMSKYYYYGWHYAHAGDYINLPYEVIKDISYSFNEGNIDWSLGQVVEHLVEAAYQMLCFQRVADKVLSDRYHRIVSIGLRSVLFHGLILRSVLFHGLILLPKRIKRYWQVHKGTYIP